MSNCCMRSRVEAGVSAFDAAARAGGLGDDLQIAGLSPQVEQVVRLEIAVERRPLAVREAGIEVVERESEPAQVLVPQRGCEVEAVGGLFGAMKHACEATDQDVADALALERGQDRVRVETLAVAAHELRSARLCVRRNRCRRRSGERIAFLRSRSSPEGS